MIAVMKTGGKQYLVKSGDILSIEKLEAKVGDVVRFDLLMTAEGDQVSLGKPLLSGQVSAEVLEQGRAKKVDVVHYKPKVRMSKRVGHRQPFTKVKIANIE